MEMIIKNQCAHRGGISCIFLVRAVFINQVIKNWTSQMEKTFFWVIDSWMQLDVGECFVMFCPSVQA